jgi:hypothetical protein
MPSSIISPFPVFNDLDGSPLENGYIYIGQSNLNPETSPVNVFWDAARTIPAPQPIRTIGGFPSRNGSPSNVYVENDTYSITVRNSRRVFVYSAFDQSDAPSSVFDISTQVITATAGQTTFTLTVFTYLPGTDTLQVYRNGLRLTSGTDYAESNTSTVTMTSPAAAGDEFLFQGGAVITGNQTPGTAVSFIQAGTGAVTRNMQDKARETLSVADFGDVDAIGDIVLSVPSQYATIQSALDFLRTKKLQPGTTAKIQVADGLYVVTSAINANHPNGSQIQIIGNEGTPANCILQIVGNPSFDVFSVTNGNVLGKLNGFRINCTVKAGLANNFTGVLANNGATIICGNKMEVNNFYYGIAARNGSFVECPGAVVTNAGDVGIWAFCGSTVFCDGATSNDASDVTNGFGFGFQAEFGSTLVGANLSASGCYKAGIAALSNSTCRTHSSTCNANTGSGFLSWAGGQIECNGSSTTNNTRYGIEITEYANIIGVVTNTGNTLGAANNFAFLSATGGQARVSSSVGPLRVDTNDASPVFFNTANGLQFSVRAGPSSTVNRVEVSGAATGNAVAIYSEGSDSVVDLALLPKGVGSYVQLGAGFNASGGSIAGWIGIKDHLGVVRKLAVIS